MKQKGNDEGYTPKPQRPNKFRYADLTRTDVLAVRLLTRPEAISDAIVQLNPAKYASVLIRKDPGTDLRNVVQGNIFRCLLQP